MQINNKNQSGASSLLDSLDAMTNKRAFFALIIAAITALVTMSLAGFLFSEGETWSTALGGFIVLIAILTMWTGFSASGFLLMDQTRGVEVRSLGDAYLGALFTLPKMIALVLTQLLIFLGLLIVVALLLLVCKIPELGPVLYTVVFPITAAVSGLVIAGLFYVFTSLFLPCLWVGCTYREVLARLWAITKQRLAMVILLLVMLVLLTGFVSMFIGGVTFGGISLVGAMSAAILEFSVSDLAGVLEILSGNFGDGFVGPGMLGASLLIAAAMTLPMLVYIKGLCHIYLQAAEGLDFTEIERALDEQTEQLRKRAQEAQQRARASVEKTREPTKAPATVLAQNLACPSCQATVTADDAFCDACGHKLK